MKKFIVLLALGLCLNACGLETTTTKNEFFLLMYGVYSDPLETPEGNTAPKFYEMTFENVILTRTDGDIVTLSPDSSQTVRILDREQIVFTGDLSDLENVTFSSASAVFAPDAVVGAKYRKDHALTLAQSEYSSQEFTAEKGKNIKMSIEVRWQFTIDEDPEAEAETIFQPQYAVEIDTTD